MITPAHLPHVTDRDPVLNPSPQGGTLTAAGVASPVAWDNRSLLEYRVYAEHRQTTEQCSMFGFIKLVPPKGGTLTAAGTASRAALNNPSPLEYRVYAEHRQITEQCSCFVS